jgi:CHRD domain
VWQRILMIVTGLLVIGAVGVGVAAAQSGYGDGGGGGSTGKPSQPSEPPGDMTASRQSWTAYLNGQAEVDGDGDDAGDPDAKGSAMFLQIDERTVCYGFALRGADTPTVVHIHKGKVGENGPPVVMFANAPKDASGAPSGDPGASSGCKTTEDPAEIAALRRIRRNPSNYYVNFHTQSFPDGAVRGQLSRMWYDNGQ